MFYAKVFLATVLCFTIFTAQAQTGKDFHSCMVSQIGSHKVIRVYFDFENLQIDKQRTSVKVDKINYFDANNCTLIYSYQIGVFSVTLRGGKIITASLIDDSKYYELLQVRTK